ncbi:MAG TPA: hypothetical protein VHB70_01025 [Parafilimonas sp.]|nr:hypothetical protein [Parafilimonas sp.]
MRQYLNNWNFIRLLRLALGIIILIEGINTNDWMYIIAGVLFSLMPVFNIGCCGMGSCSIPNKHTSKHSRKIS